MPKEPLYPHTPKSREPLFPHVARGEVSPQTGTCYEDAWRFLIKEGEGELVHGTVQTIGRINHAWVETETDYIWEPESNEFMKDDYFYERAKPQVDARYSPEEAAIMATRTKNLGPWTKEERRQYLGEATDSPKRLPQTVVTVTCPICGKVIEIPEYNKVTRSGALKKHLEEGCTKGPRLPQTTIEGGEPVPPQYRHLIGWIDEPLPEYSLMTQDYSLQVAFMPAIEAVEGERKIDAVMKQLRTGVEGIQESHQFRLFLTTMAKFHDYSIGNQILIMLQKPDATHVAGFNTWKDLGRWVKRGEKGISILAPVMPPRPTCPKCGAKIPRGARYCSRCGESVEVEEEVEVHYFKVVSVFDINQTEGKPLPEFEVPVLTGEVNEELFSNLLTLTKKRGVPISFESRPHLDPSIKGQYSISTGIWIRPEEPRAQQLKSLAHEIAHYYSEGVFRIPRRDAETIAESAAYVIGAHYGFDTGVRSFPYVALWAQDKKVLEKNIGEIRKVATTIIEALG